RPRLGRRGKRPERGLHLVVCHSRPGEISKTGPTLSSFRILVGAKSRSETGWRCSAPAPCEHHDHGDDPGDQEQAQEPTEPAAHHAAASHHSAHHRAVHQQAGKQEYQGEGPNAREHPEQRIASATVRHRIIPSCYGPVVSDSAYTGLSA